MVTRARIGSLSAHGLTDIQISEALLLRIEQVIACKESEEFKKKYAEEADKQIQSQLDRDEGWDAVEEEGIKQILQTLQYNRDPKFALAAAMTANRADRRKRRSDAPVIVDNSTNTTNIITLNLNKKFVDKSSGSSAVDISPKVIDQPRRRADLPSPKAVNELLAPVRNQMGDIVKPRTDLEMMFDQAGVFKDDE